jgi:hypothetical protein
VQSDTSGHCAKGNDGVQDGVSKHPAQRVMRGASEGPPAPTTREDTALRRKGHSQVAAWRAPALSGPSNVEPTTSTLRWAPRQAAGTTA